MRAFRISLVLFLLIMALIIIGTWYGRRVCNELERMIGAMSAESNEQSAAEAEAVRRYWEKQIRWLRPIINRTALRSISDLLSDLTVYAAEEDNSADYRATHSKLLGAIDEMRRAEKATFGLWS